MRIKYLDGLRGWAALFVLLGHLGPVFLLAKQKLAILPFFIDGQLAVYVFFVLSAYVLSAGFLEKNDPDILTTLAIRRYPRLTIPILASCSIAFVLVKTGATFNLTAGSMAQSPWLESFYNFPVSVENLIKFTTFEVYTDSTAPSYNAVLWTMRYEFWGSLGLLAFLRLLPSKWPRVMGYSIATTVCIYYETPLIAFVFGVICAELSLTAQKAIKANQKIAFWLSFILMSAALLTSAYRSQLMLWSPLWLSIMATAILAATILNPWLNKVLSNRFSQFLGKISFPLYLTHLLVICSWSSWLYIQLAEENYSATIASITIAASTVLVSIGVATIFSPVEDYSISIGKKFSNFFFSMKSIYIRK